MSSKDKKKMKKKKLKRNLV